MKAIEQYFHVILVFMMHTVVLTFKSVDETLVCDHSYESYWAVLSCGTVKYDILDAVVLPFKSVDETIVCDSSNKSY